MTLEEYIKQNYKEDKPLSYEKWLIAQVDFNGNGKVDSGKIYRTNKNGRQVWTGAYYKEDNAYKKLQKDPATYSNWEAYVQTKVQQNAERLRQVKAIWETSQAYEKGAVEAADAFNSDKKIQTIGDKEQEYYVQNTKLDFVKYAIIGGVAIVLILIITSKKK